MNNILYTQIVHLAACLVVGFLLVWLYVTKGDPTPLWIPFGALVGVALPSPFGAVVAPVVGSVAAPVVTPAPAVTATVVPGTP